MTKWSYLNSPFYLLRRAEQRLQRKRAHKAELDEFKRQQRSWRLVEEQRIREENERIIREMVEQESRVDHVAVSRKERQQQLEDIQVGWRML